MKISLRTLVIVIPALLGIPCWTIGREVHKLHTINALTPEMDIALVESKLGKPETKSHGCWTYSTHWGQGWVEICLDEQGMFQHAHLESPFD